MITIPSIPGLRKYLDEASPGKAGIGFVPTMGALHKGHLSLLERARSENRLVVCSIFVNPTQFNDPADLDRYPRTPEADSLCLEKSGCDALFMPGVKEMYPDGFSDERVLDLGLLDKVMEGKSRPGHFRGVVQIVSRLFEAVKPARAYFGQKDWQQVAVIREMTRQLGLPVEIVACPIVREPDGLAMSSRNVLLSREERRVAPGIYAMLLEVKKKSASVKVPDLISWVMAQTGLYAGMSLEYFEIVDAQTLSPVRSLDDAGQVVACIAVKLGKIRLIDNILLK